MQDNQYTHLQKCFTGASILFGIILILEALLSQGNILAKTCGPASLCFFLTGVFWPWASGAKPALLTILISSFPTAGMITIAVITSELYLKSYAPQSAKIATYVPYKAIAAVFTVAFAYGIMVQLAKRV